MTVAHEADAIATGLTQASSVMAPVRSSGFASAIVTQSLTPSKERAAPWRPLAVRVAPEMVPLLAEAEASWAAVPEGSSKP